MATKHINTHNQETNKLEAIVCGQNQQQQQKKNKKGKKITANTHINKI